MKNFIDVMKEIENTTFTENGGRACKSTGSDLLNLFATIGALRTRTEFDICDMWRKARQENETLADNIILYARDIRNGGLGERKTARILLKELARYNPQKIEKNFDTIVEAGRWDDLFIFLNTKVEDSMLNFIKNQFFKDLTDMQHSKSISLLAKWLPSVNASSRQTKSMARYICRKWALQESTYRKALSKLRRYIKVVEGKMSAREWNTIDFESVPSLAMLRYNNAFDRNCSGAFAEYKRGLITGEKKINASTLYPYNIIQPFLSGTGNIGEIEEAQWKNLPNYINEDMQVLVVCDTSGSMYSDYAQPISTAIGLSIYFAQRNKGAYHNMLMTFSGNPSIIRLSDNASLKDCIFTAKKGEWGWSTDLDKSFAMIYDIAKVSRDVPQALVIISDMEINNWDGSGRYKSITEKWADKFAQIGLKMPKLIYWNVCARNNTFNATQSDNVAFVSGSGVGPFKNFIESIEYSAYDSMVKILTQPQFSWK